MTWIKVKFAIGLGAAALLAGGAATVALSSDKTSSSADSAEVIAFKDYFSRPHRIARIEYTELPSGRRFIGAADGTNFYYRGLTGGINPDQPISAKNKMRSGFFVGRLGDMRWQIVGFSITKASNPDPGHPDAYTTFADSSRLILDGILNLGNQMVEPGSFRWNGENVEADLSQAYASQIHVISSVSVDNKGTRTTNSTGLPKTFSGKITVKNGLVREMTVNREKFKYDYDPAANLPKGIPSKIIGDQTITIQKLVFADAEGVDTDVFDPTRYVVPELQTIKIVSNSVTILDPQPTKLAFQAIYQDLQEQLQEQKQLADKHNAHRHWMFMLIFFVALMFLGWFGFTLWKRRN